MTLASRSSNVIVIDHLYSFIFIVNFQFFAYLFLSRTSKLMGNRKIDILSLNKPRFSLFLMFETFAVLLGYIVYNMLFYNIVDIFLKFNFESIVISSSVADETDFVVISPICNVCEHVLPTIIN